MSSSTTPRDAFSRSMFHASLVAMATFSIADMNPAFFVLAMLGIWSVWLFSVRDRRPAPRIVINTVLLFVVGIAGIEMLRSGVGVESFAVFAALLLIVKMLDLREPRDAGQVLVLTIALVIAAILTSNSLFTGVFMILACVLLMRSVLLYQMYWVSFLSGDSSVEIHRKAKIDTRSILLATGFLCALLGTLVFIVLPRNLGSDAFGQWGQSGGSISGFSESVELDRPGLISSSSVPVLDLTVTDRDGLNIGSENSPAVYLRGAVLYDYQSGDWRKSSAMQNPLTARTRLIPANTTLKPRSTAYEAAWDQQFEVSMRASSTGQVYLFAPWRTVEFRVGAEPMRLGLDFRRGIFVKDGVAGKLDYTVRSSSFGVQGYEFSEELQRSALFPTIIEPEIHQMAQRVLRNAGVEPDPKLRDLRDDQAAIGIFERHLRTQYKYSLDSLPVPDDQDATRWFLFERQAGHCEYFASALALMSRSVGIPARVITGYIVSDFNTVTGQYTVRESNAHAWVEAEIAPGEWQTYDGTPRADFHAIHVPDPSLMRSLMKFYESVEFLWVRSVVGYDSVSRQNFVGGDSDDFGITSFADSLMRRFAIGRDRLILKGLLVALIVFTMSMFTGIVMLRYRSLFVHIREWISTWVERVKGRIFAKQADCRGGQWAMVEQLLNARFDELDIPKPSWKPMKQHVADHAQVIGTLPQSSRQAITQAIRMVYCQRFELDPVPMDREQISDMEQALAKSEKPSAKSISQDT